jgi:hypothetical protein
VEVGRKQDRKSERVQVLGLHLQRKSHGKGASERGSEEGEQGSWMRLGNRREKVGRRMMMFESMVESELIYGTEI